MEILWSVFSGGEGGISWWGAGFALIIVLVLIIAGLWLLKLLFKASGSVTRGRQRRLAVIDTLNMDAKRNLVLIRRDDVEHLLVIGGAQDVVVETGISNAEAAPIRSASPKPSARQQAPTAVAVDTLDEPERQRTAAASRLGLTGLLRRYNDPKPDQEPEVDIPEVSPLERLKNLGQPQTERTGPALRDTGLLRPASNDDEDDQFDQTTVEEPQIPIPSVDDSAMNGLDQTDAGAKASTEQEAAADNAESDDADEFAAQTADITVESDEFAPEVSIDDKDSKPKEPGFESDLDEDATEPPNPRTQH